MRWVVLIIGGYRQFNWVYICPGFSFWGAIMTFCMLWVVWWLAAADVFEFSCVYYKLFWDRGLRNLRGSVAEKSTTVVLWWTSILKGWLYRWTYHNSLFWLAWYREKSRCSVRMFDGMFESILEGSGKIWLIGEQLTKDILGTHTCIHHIFGMLPRTWLVPPICTFTLTDPNAIRCIDTFTIT